MAHPQQRAIAHVTTLATGEPMDPSWRVTLHFHPDRLVTGVPILQLMSHDGIYRSQFETGTSNGGLTAHPGGDRWRWESRIFAGAYDDEPVSERPKYGSLNFRRRLVGGSPRFGSAYLRLGPHTLARTTFCYPDSVYEPEHFGVASRLSSLVVLAEADDKDPLDDYVEAQVHGVIDLTRDVEALVLDPCHRGTPIDTAARRLACPIEWHGGFTLTTTELHRHPSYRGLEFVNLGVSLARDGRLNPRIIGDASRTGRYDQQALKRVWHYVARFGSSEMSALTHSQWDTRLTRVTATASREIGLRQISALHTVPCTDNHANCANSCMGPKADHRHKRTPSPDEPDATRLNSRSAKRRDSHTGEA